MTPNQVEAMACDSTKISFLIQPTSWEPHSYIKYLFSFFHFFFFFYTLQNNWPESTSRCFVTRTEDPPTMLSDWGAASAKIQHRPARWGSCSDWILAPRLCSLLKHTLLLVHLTFFFLIHTRQRWSSAAQSSTMTTQSLISYFVLELHSPFAFCSSCIVVYLKTQDSSS